MLKPQGPFLQTVPLLPEEAEIITRSLRCLQKGGVNTAWAISPCIAVKPTLIDLVSLSVAYWIITLFIYRNHGWNIFIAFWTVFLNLHYGSWLFKCWSLCQTDFFLKFYFVHYCFSVTYGSHTELYYHFYLYKSILNILCSISVCRFYA